MKRFFTLAIISMVAMISFAQAPAQVKKAAQKHTLQHVLSTQSLAKMNETKAQQAVMAEKAQAANESGVSVVRRGVKANLPEMKPVVVSDRKLNAQITRQALNPVKYTAASKSLKAKKGASVKALAATAKIGFAAGDAPRFAAPKTAVADGTTYYIQNVESGLFFAGNNSWGTQASAVTAGDPTTVTAVEGGYTLTGASLTSGNKTLGYNLFVDTNTAQNGNVWTIAPVAGEDGVFTIYGKGKKDNVEDAFDGYVAQSATAGAVTGYVLEGVSEVTDAAKWRFITKEELVASIQAGDNISSLFVNPGFTRTHSTTEWIVDEGCTNKNLAGGANNNFCAESYHSLFNIHQTITGIPNGTYTVTAQGFYRQDGTDEENLPVFYANETTSVFPLKTGTENSMTDASNSFTAGLYTIEAFDVEVTDGTLTIGVKNEANTSLWCIWDNFQVTCKELAVPAIEIEATTGAATYYPSDGDWYCVLRNAQNVFAFDIVTNNPVLELNHVYTLADMDPDYSYCAVNGSQAKKTYAAATFMAKEGQYGTDYEATATLTNGDVYHIIYTATAPETIDVEATNASATWYGEPDNDWFIVLQNSSYQFRFDINNQSASGLLLDHEYTMADMMASYSWGKNQITGEQISYKTVSLKALQGANGTDYAATVVDNSNNTYNITYTTVAPPEPTETVEIEFTSDETDLVDAAASQGVVQFIGSKADTGLEAYVALNTTQIAGTYTIDDVYTAYTAIYLDFDDYVGVDCADLTGTVTDLGNGAYKAVFDYLGVNGTLYKLTFNYGEGGDDPDPTTDVVVTKDENGLITSVTGGEKKSYKREGTAYFVQGGSMYYGDQEGMATIVEDAANGKIYIQNPISKYTQGSWAEGVVEDGKVIVAAKQPLAFSTEYSATISLRWGVVGTDGSIAPADAHADNFVYVIDGDKLILQGTESFATASDDAYFMGAFWDDDDSSTGYGDAETVLTYDPGYVGPSYDLVELPDGAQTADWYLNASKISSSTTTAIKNQAIKTAFVGDDVYVQGIFADMPNAWVKGTISGSSVSFAKGQYLGKYGTSYDIWFMGTDGEGLTDASASYDAAKNEITFANDILANAKPDAIYYLSWLNATVLSKDSKSYEEPIITDLTATLPYANSFDTEAEQAEAAIYDANEDGRTFTFSAPSSGDNTTTAARYTYSAANEGDDYVVFPGLTLTAGTSYKVSVDARAYGASFPEKFEVVAGTVAKASQLNIPVIPATEVASAAYETYAVDFTPEADGVYYFAIHAISEADQFYLYTDNFSVKENNVNAPENIADLTVTPDANAELKATLKFTAPSKNLAGEAYAPGTVCEITVSRDGEEIDTFERLFGTEVEFVDGTIEAPGTYTWSVTATLNGLSTDAAKATAYVGEDTPMDVDNLAAADMNTQVALSWDAVGNIGSKGGIVKPENVWYNVYPVEMIEFWGMTFPSIDYDNPYATGVKETSYNVDYNTNEGEQGYNYFAVAAENIAGESGGTMAALLTGAPYELPFMETLPGGSLDYWWGVDYDDDNYNADGGIGIGQNADGSYNFTFNAKTAGWIELYSGKVATNGADKAQLVFNYSGAGTLKVIAYSSDKEADAVVLTPSADAQTASIDLAQFASEPWVRFTVRGEYEAAAQTVISNILVMNMVENDLEIAVAAPKTVAAGNEANVVATVKNVGTEDATEYSVKFYINDVEAPAPLFEYPTLKFMESATFEFPIETSIFDEAGDITVKAEVVYASDVKPETNTDEAVITLLAPGASPIEDLTASLNADNTVSLAWTIPASTIAEVVESFEEPVAPAAGLIYADGEYCGNWLSLDKSQGSTYGWNSEAILWDHMGDSYGFGIINFEASAVPSIEAASGAQAAIFMSEVNPQTSAGQAADKYMISPVLPGVAQTISFKALPITAQYGAETFEVLASSTDTEIASFTKVASFSTDIESWTEFTANLPEGTKYFAIHYTSNDIFGLFIDDLAYTTVAGVKPEMYNIYIDQVLVAGVEGEATSYTYDQPLTVGEHTVSVSAIVNGKETAPVTKEVSVVTGVKGLTIDLAAKFNVYSVEGVCVRKNVSDLNGLTPGVYVVNGKKVLVK